MGQNQYIYSNGFDSNNLDMLCFPDSPETSRSWATSLGFPAGAGYLPVFNETQTKQIANFIKLGVETVQTVSALAHVCHVTTTGTTNSAAFSTDTCLVQII